MSSNYISSNCSADYISSNCSSDYSSNDTYNIAPDLLKMTNMMKMLNSSISNSSSGSEDGEEDDEDGKNTNKEKKTLFSRGGEKEKTFRGGAVEYHPTAGGSYKALATGGQLLQQSAILKQCQKVENSFSSQLFFLGSVTIC